MTSNPPIGPILEAFGWNGRATGYGDWKTIRCPFHGDRHASGRVNETEEVFHCHACGVSGNAYKVLEQYEGLTNDEAKRRVQDITGFVSSGIPGRPSGPGGGYRSRLPSWTRDRGKRKRLVPLGNSRQE